MTKKSKPPGARAEPAQAPPTKPSALGDAARQALYNPKVLADFEASLKRARAAADQEEAEQEAQQREQRDQQRNPREGEQQ